MPARVRKTVLPIKTSASSGVVGVRNILFTLEATHILMFPTLSVKLTLLGGWISTCDAKIV